MILVHLFQFGPFSSAAKEEGAAIYIDIGGCVQCTFTIRDIERVSEWRQTLLLSLVLSILLYFQYPICAFLKAFYVT